MSTVRIKSAQNFNNLVKVAQDYRQSFDFAVKKGIFYFTANTEFLKSQGYLTYK